MRGQPPITKENDTSERTNKKIDASVSGESQRVIVLINPVPRISH